MEKLELKNVKGSFDYESKDQIIRNYISNTLEEVFERYLVTGRRVIWELGR